jgi:FKBP-type peptidyl-prolyl cis-trans isomerase (trigger factor)
MSKSQTNQQIQTLQTPSALDRFALSFEYNKTLQEIKQEVRQRTI